MCFGQLPLLLVEGSSETGLFRYLSSHVFGVRNFRNTLAMRVIFCLEMFKISCRFQKLKKKREKIFGFEIIAYELVALNCLY